MDSNKLAGILIEDAPHDGRKYGTTDGGAAK